MVALGTMNIVGSMTSCYVATGNWQNLQAIKIYPFYLFLYKTTNSWLFIAVETLGMNWNCVFAAGSFSRSAVNYMAGCKTAVSNVVMAIVVMLTLLLITPLFKYTPNAILASIIINAVVGLVDYESAYLIWKVDKMDFVACLGAFFGVIFASVEYGLLIAVCISTISFMLFTIETPLWASADDCWTCME